MQSTSADYILLAIGWCETVNDALTIYTSSDPVFFLCGCCCCCSSSVVVVVVVVANYINQFLHIIRLFPCSSSCASTFFASHRRSPCDRSFCKQSGRDGGEREIGEKGKNGKLRTRRTHSSCSSPHHRDYYTDTGHRGFLISVVATPLHRFVGSCTGLAYYYN